MNEKTWREVVDLAEHYLAIGQTDVYLSERNCMDRPWEHVTRVKAGNTVSYGDIRWDIRIKAEHPCGITFEWWVELEKRGSDYSSIHEIDMERLLALLEKLPVATRPQLRDHLATTSEAIYRYISEKQQWLDKERRQADALYRLSTTEAQP